MSSPQGRNLPKRENPRAVMVSWGFYINTTCCKSAKSIFFTSLKASMKSLDDLEFGNN